MGKPNVTQVDVARATKIGEIILMIIKERESEPFMQAIVAELAFHREEVLAAHCEGQWQDISTAPKDGTRVLISLPTDDPAGWIELAYYDASNPPPFCASPWCNRYGQGYTVAPIQWQPLPAVKGAGNA